MRSTGKSHASPPSKDRNNVCVYWNYFFQWQRTKILIVLESGLIIDYYNNFISGYWLKLCSVFRLDNINSHSLSFVFQTGDEFSRVQRERDELQKMLETFEKHLAKVYFISIYSYLNIQNNRKTFSKSLHFQSILIKTFLHFMIKC